jgi:predicted ATP-binding protein involved in virulence
MGRQLNVRLEDVKLTNFRLFEQISVQFHPNLTVFIGANGAGKTTLLEGVAPLLTLLAQKIRNQALDLKGVGDAYDVRIGTVEAVNEIKIVLSDTTAGNAESDVALEYFVTFNEEDGYTPDDASDTRSFDKLDAVAKAVSDQIKLARRKNIREKGLGLPVLIYYPCMEAQDWEKSNLGAQKKHERYNPYMTYDHSLTRDSFNFNAFFNWFKWREQINLQKRDEDGDRDFDAVKRAVYAMFNDDPEKPDQYYNLATDYTQFSEGELKLEKEGVSVNVNRMSSGEKAVFALAADLAYRLSIANLNNEDDPLTGNGIVLIDEVDLHLHPKWQRAILPKLQKLFPGIQFVVTTHSPGVLQNVPKESVRVLINGTIRENGLYTRGRDIESIYFDAFGEEEYPPEQSDLLDKMRRCYDLIDEGDNKSLKAAEQLIRELEAEWGETDKKIIELKTLLELADI